MDEKEKSVQCVEKTATSTTLYFSDGTKKAYPNFNPLKGLTLQLSNQICNTDFRPDYFEGWKIEPRELHAPKPIRPDFLIPNFIGVKKGEITLVWGEKGDLYQETTKAVLSDGDAEDFELGFLIAYYKRVHKAWGGKTLREKIVELFDAFKDDDGGVKNYMRSIFLDNCRLEIPNAVRFLKYIINRQDQAPIVIPKNFIYKEEKK